MPRSLDLVADSPHPLERIRAAFDERDYWAARLAFVAGGEPTLDELHTDDAGTTSVQMTMRFGGDDLPGPLRKLRLASLAVVQREQWFAPEGDVVRGRLVVEAPRTPISGHGDVTMRTDGSGTRLNGTAVVKVAVPIFGGPIAGFIANMLAEGIVDLVRVTDGYLDGVR